MSYLTMEVEINKGRVAAKGTDVLPEKASGLLTILHPPARSAVRPVGLAKGDFVVPHDFNASLPEEVLQRFEG